MPQAPSARCANCTPLRRAEHHALLAHLAAAPRAARLAWAGMRIVGTMQVDGPRHLVQFRPAGDLGPDTPLPTPGQAADLLFRVHGIGFRCDGTVRRADDRGDVYLDPAVIEWSVRGFRVGGVAFSMEPSEALLRSPDGRATRLSVLAIHDDEVFLLGWPVPRGIEPGTTYPSMLLLGKERLRGYGSSWRPLRRCSLAALGASSEPWSSRGRPSCAGS